MTDRAERLFFEQQVRQLDDMARTIMLMRSVLARRIRWAEGGGGGGRRAAPGVHPLLARARGMDWQVNLVDDLVDVAVNLNGRFDQEVPAPVPVPAPAPVRARPVPLQLPVRPRPVPAPKRTVKALKASEMAKVSADVCAICHDHHPKHGVLRTNCGHEFGTVCLETWIETKKRAHQTAQCPLCAQHIQHITAFRPWGKRKAAAMVSDDEEEVVVVEANGPAALPV